MRVVYAKYGFGDQLQLLLSFVLVGSLGIKAAPAPKKLLGAVKFGWWKRKLIEA